MNSAAVSLAALVAPKATVCLRNTKPKGRLSHGTALVTAFKPLLSAMRKWRRFKGSDQLAEILRGVMYKVGIKRNRNAA